jgi:hypothetical protein
MEEWCRYSRGRGSDPPRSSAFDSNDADFNVWMSATQRPVGAHGVLRILAALALATALLACRATPEVFAFLTVVNRSSSAATLTTTKDGAPYTGIIPQTVEGCRQDRLGLESGTYDITIKTDVDSADVVVRAVPTQHPPGTTIVIAPDGQIEPNAPEWISSIAPC